MANQVTRRLGKICRIYKNSLGTIIATESVEIVADQRRLTAERFHRSVNTINVSRTAFHLDTNSRVVATIQVFGDFSSIETNGGNYFIATWNKSSPNENDVTTSIEGKVAEIGDTV